MKKEHLKDKIERREKELKRRYFRELIGTKKKELLKYHDDYFNIPNKFKEIAESSFYKTLGKGTIIILGDIHYSKQAKKSIRNVILKFLERFGDDDVDEINKTAKKISIALEIIDDKNHSSLIRYINEEFDFSQFSKAAKFSKNWGLNFETYYRPLFDFLQSYKLDVKPLFVDPRKAHGNLAARDELMASRIIDYKVQEPDKHLFVIVGDWHSSSNHLHSELCKQIDLSTIPSAKKLKDKVISCYLNHDLIWERKKVQGNMETQYFRISKNVFAIADTRPDVKFFSVYEKTNIGDDLDPDDIFDDSLYQHIFNSIVNDLADILDLDLQLVENWRDKIEIFTPHILDHFFERLESKKRELGFISKSKLDEVKVQIVKYGSCFIPVSSTTNWVFISSTCTPNQYAQMATRYLRDNFITKIKASGEINKFYLKVIDEGLRFVGNKLINNFVQCNELEKSFRTIRDYNTKKNLSRIEKTDLAIAEAIQEHLELERGCFDHEKARQFVDNFYPLKARKISGKRNHEMYIGCVRILGRLLGDEIFKRSLTLKEEDRIHYLRGILLKDYAENAVDNYLALKIGRT